MRQAKWPPTLIDSHEWKFVDLLTNGIALSIKHRLKWMLQKEYKCSRFAYLTWELLFDCGFWNGFLAGAVSRFKLPFDAATDDAADAPPTFGKFIWFSSFAFFFLRWRTRLRFEPVEPIVSLVPDSMKSSFWRPPATVPVRFCGESNSIDGDWLFDGPPLLVISLAVVRKWELTFCSVNAPNVSDVAEIADSLSLCLGVTLYKWTRISQPANEITMQSKEIKMNQKKRTYWIMSPHSMMPMCSLAGKENRRTE